MSNPFRGLVSFDEGDAGAFFERDADVDATIGHLWSARICLLFAGSGVGKTSFLRAKLVPRLKTLLGPQSVRFPDKWAEIDPLSSIRSMPEGLGALAGDNDTRIVILDQFEEVFQYFPNPSLLNALGKELAILVNPSIRRKAGSRNTDDVRKEAGDSASMVPGHTRGGTQVLAMASDVRVIISVREEFLAELSTFDAFLPNLLSNYYRLERPTIRQTQNIIEKTAALLQVSVSNNITILLDDLRTVQETNRRGVFIDPPYLQIVCKQLWHDEMPSEEKPFLLTYKTGMARQILREYCDRRLDGLTWSEKVTTNKAIGYLTTGRFQAKRSVKLQDILQEIGQRHSRTLAASLDKLSIEDAKILRRWEESVGTEFGGEKGKQRTEVYALYHDMYAPMLWEWRDRQERLERKRMAAWWTLAGILLFFFILWPTWKYLNVRSALRHPDYGNDGQFAGVLEFRNALAQTIIGRPLADLLWDKYTNELASVAALRLDTDGAMLYRLSGVAVSGRVAAPDDVAKVVGSERYLIGTFAGGPDADIVDASILKDGDTILAVTRSGRVLRWSLLRPDAAPTSNVIDVDFGDHLYSHPGALGVLALSPSDQDPSAAVCWLHGGSEGSEIRLGLVSNDGRLISPAFRWPRVPTTTTSYRRGLRGRRGKVVSAGIRPDAAQAGDDSRLLLERVSRMQAFYSPNGEMVGVVDTKQGMGFILRNSGREHMEVPLDHITRLGFAEKENVIAVTQHDPSDTQDSDTVSFLTIGPDNQLRAQKPPRPATLPSKARLVFSRRGDVMAIVDDRWSWVSGNSVIPVSYPVSSEPPIYLSGYEEDSSGKGGLSLWTDPTGVMSYAFMRAGRLESQYVVMSSAPRTPFLPEARRMTGASLVRFKEGKILTIDEDGRAVRVWEVPSPDVIRKYAVRSVMPPFPGPVVHDGDQHVPNFSLRNKDLFSAAVASRQLQITGPRVWTRMLPPEIVPDDSAIRDLTVSADGASVLVSAGDSVLYVPENGEIRKGPRGSIAFNRNREALAIASADKVNVLGLRNESTWSRDIRSKGLTEITVGADGKRVLLWLEDRIVYVPESGKITAIPKGSVFDATFGPGSKKLTLLSRTHVIVYDAEDSTDVRFDSNDVHLLHGADESQIVLYSQSWLHNLTADGDTVKIVSLFEEFPLIPGPSPYQATMEIKPTNVYNNNEVEVPAYGRTINIHEQARTISVKEGTRSVVTWLDTLRINPCSAGSPGQIADDHNNPPLLDYWKRMSESLMRPLRRSDPEWREIMCSYEKKTDRQAGQILGQP